MCATPNNGSRRLAGDPGAPGHFLDQRDEEHRGEEERGQPDHEADEAHRRALRYPRGGGSSRHLALENGGEPDYTVVVPDSFKEFEATTLFCARCKQATAVRKRLLLVLPTGHKYDYACSV